MVNERKLIAPSLYIQGDGVLDELGKRARPLGRNAFVIGGRTALSLTERRIRNSLEEEGVEIVAVDDGVRDCTHATIDRLVEKGKDAGPEFVVGVGGGRAVDTAKAVAWKLGVPAVTIGTQCATNADGSAESVVYTEDHKFLECVILPSNPAVVLVDTGIIAKAPVKFMIQGMGDALSTKFEAEAYAKARAKRKDGPPPTRAALALADATYNALIEHGMKAVEDLKRGEHSEHVDEVIEAVKLSSAIAFENTGCALAHALHNGLTQTGEAKGEHGEIVAYGTLVQVVYEGRPKDTVRSMVEWCRAIGLPTRLKDIGGPSKAALKTAVDHACNRDANADSMPERPVPGDVMRAIEELEKMS